MWPWFEEEDDLPKKKNQKKKNQKEKKKKQINDINELVPKNKDIKVKKLNFG